MAEPRSASGKIAGGLRSIFDRVGALLCACASYFAFRRGADYFKYQIEDVVAHFGVASGTLMGQRDLGNPTF